MIAIRGLRHQLLAIPSLDIPPGVTTVIGRNGSGKTTLLRLLAGILEPAEGSVLIGGRTPRSTETGWVNEFPDRNLLFDTVQDEVASPLMFRDIPCDQARDRVNEILEVTGIGALTGRPTRELSGGEKNLVALAAALVLRPQVMVLDEFDSHIDGERAREMDRVIRSCTIPYVIRCTHQMETARTGDWLLALEDGRVRVAGPPDEAFDDLAGTPFYPLSLRCRP